MEPMWSEAQSLIFQGASGGSYTGGPFRGVLHTTQSRDYHPSTTEYYGHLNPPHFTLALKNGAAVMYQHYSIKVASRALANPPGGVETNRRSAIQIEIAWTAEKIDELPDVMVEKLKSWMRWVELQTGAVRKAPKFFGSAQAYGTGSSTRMSGMEWDAFDGWCGHQHVPENSHWDPGVIDINRLLAP
jgi:hypothetical protein